MLLTHMEGFFTSESLELTCSELWWDLGSAMEENNQEFRACSGDGGSWTRETRPAETSFLLRGQRARSPRADRGAHGTPGATPAAHSQPGWKSPRVKVGVTVLPQPENTAGPGPGGFLTPPLALIGPAPAPSERPQSRKPELCGHRAITTAGGWRPEAGTQPPLHPGPAGYFYSLLRHTRREKDLRNELWKAVA